MYFSSHILYSFCMNHFSHEWCFPSFVHKEAAASALLRDLLTTIRTLTWYNLIILLASFIQGGGHPLGSVPEIFRYCFVSVFFLSPTPNPTLFHCLIKVKASLCFRHFAEVI